MHCTVGRAYPFDVSDVDYIDRTVVYVGMFHTVWGHCITDNLKHLWFTLDGSHHDLCYQDLVYLVMSKSPADLPDNFWKILDRLGIEKERMMTVDRVTRFKSILIPDQCFMLNGELGHRQFTKEYTALIDRLSAGIEPAAYERLYFTRTAFRSHKDLGSGEKRMERMLASIGYEIVCPESLALEEQISLLKGCSIFVSTDGSASHNAVFLKEDATAVIVRKAGYQNGYQAAINKLKRINVVYIDSHKSVMCSRRMPWDGPFFVYPNRRFCSYFGIRYMGFPFASFVVYLLNGAWRLGKRTMKRVLKGILVALRFRRA